MLPFEKHLATLLTQIEVDPADPAFGNPTKPIGPVYTEADATALAAEKSWTFKPDGDGMRRVVPSPRAEADLRAGDDPGAPRHRLRRHLRRRRRDPGHVHRRARPRRPPAGGHRGGDRQGPRERSASRRPEGERARDRHRRRRCLRRVGHARAAADRAGDAGGAAERRVRRGLDGPEGEGRVPVRGADRRQGRHRLDRRTPAGCSAARPARPWPHDRSPASSHALLARRDRARHGLDDRRGHLRAPRRGRNGRRRGGLAVLSDRRRRRRPARLRLREARYALPELRRADHVPAGGFRRGAARSGSPPGSATSPRSSS